MSGFFVRHAENELTRAILLFSGSHESTIYLFRRIILRKTTSQFCWKCSRSAGGSLAIGGPRLGERVEISRLQLDRLTAAA